VKDVETFKASSAFLLLFHKAIMKRDQIKRNKNASFKFRKRRKKHNYSFYE